MVSYDRSLPRGGMMTLGYYYSLPGANVGQHSYGGSFGYLSSLKSTNNVPQAFRLNNLKRFNHPMGRGGNEGRTDTTHKGDLFAWLSLAVNAWPTSVALPMTIWDTPLTLNVHSWS
jgi:hypothetical protein